MKTRFLAVVAVGIVLAACGKNREDASVDSLLSDQQALQDEMKWCGKQAESEEIPGCRNAANALALESDPATITLAVLPEPLQNKDAAFFKAVAEAQAAQDRLPELEADLKNDQQQVEQAERDLQGLEARNAGGPAKKSALEQQLRERKAEVERDRAELAKLNTAITAVPQDAPKKVRKEALWCAARSELIRLHYPGKLAEETSCDALPPTAE